MNPLDEPAAKAPRVVALLPSALMIINAPGHKYDGRRVTLDRVLSERKMVQLHVEDNVYVCLRLDQVLPAPSTRKPSFH